MLMSFLFYFLDTSSTERIRAVWAGFAVYIGDIVKHRHMF